LYAAIFTNLSEEHIEAHGGFENYRAAKVKLFEAAPIHVLNADDPQLTYFSQIPGKEKILFRASDIPKNLRLGVRGEFNKMNAMAALAFSRHEGIRDEISLAALAGIKYLPGRMEYIPTGKNFEVLVDYAFLPQTLKKVYEEATTAGVKGLVCVIGATGGGRDKWKRPAIGDTAAAFCRKVIVTNEDPYDEDPLAIMDEVAGAHNFEKILDRREAIAAALRAAMPGEIVVITGKGAEPWIMGPRGTKIPWDDRKVVREELFKL
ncbi:MAG: Mur ligase family protein, partial [Patescibacteria group bacterium]